MATRRSRSVGKLTKGFGGRLRSAREERGLSQQQLATMIGASVMQISRYERSQVLPALETAVSLAQALHVSSDYLLLDRDEATAQSPAIQDVRLYERFVEAEKLSRNDREAIILLIDGVLAQRSIEGEIQRRKRA